MEALFDDSETISIVIKDGGESLVVITGRKLADEGEEKGDLELDLGGVGAVENAVEFGVFEGEIEGIVILDLLIHDFVVRDEGIFAVVGGGDVIRDLAAGVSESAREGKTDGTELGRFERRIIGGESAFEIGSAGVELFDKIARLRRVAEHIADDEN